MQIRIGISGVQFEELNERLGKEKEVQIFFCQAEGLSDFE
jgi:hypothetical protein